MAEAAVARPLPGLVTVLTRLAGRTSAALPTRGRRALGRVLGTLAWYANLPATWTARQNLAWCLRESDPDATRALARSAVRETAITLLDGLAAWGAPPGRPADPIDRVIGAALVDDALAAGRGVVIVAPHIGNWELLNRWYAHRWGVTAMYQPPRVRALEAAMRAARERDGARLVPADAGGLRALVRTLRQGRSVGVLPDQVPARGHGVMAPFFGLPALTVTLVQRLVRATGARAVSGAAIRTPRGYEIRFEALPPAIADARAEVSAAVLNAHIETIVRRWPTQYQWTYKRFKRQPPGAFRFHD